MSTHVDGPERGADEDGWWDVTDFGTRGVRATELLSGDGEHHVYLLAIEHGGEIPDHLAGFDQRFAVLQGSAWVEVDGGARQQLAAGEIATIPQGSHHSKGSADGALVLMIQSRRALETPKPRG